MDARFEQFYQVALAELQRRQRRAHSELMRQLYGALPTDEALAAIDHAVKSRSTSRQAVAKARSTLAILDRQREAGTALESGLNTSYADAVRQVCQRVWDADGCNEPGKAFVIVLATRELNRVAELAAHLAGERMDAGRWADAVDEAVREEMAEYTQRKPPTLKGPRAKPARRTPPGAKSDNAIFDRRHLGMAELVKLYRGEGETMEEAEARIRTTLRRVYKRRDRERNRKQKQQEQAE